MTARDEVEIGFREITRFGPTAVRTKDEAEAALAILIRLGSVVETSSRPRRFRVVRP